MADVRNQMAPFYLPSFKIKEKREEFYVFFFLDLFWGV